MTKPTLDSASGRADRSGAAGPADGLGMLLAIVQSLIAAYVVLALLVSPPPSMGNFASGPAVGRLALAWRDAGMTYAQVVATGAALAVAAGAFGRRGRVLYVTIALAHFALTVIAFAVLATVTVLTTGGSTGRFYDRVRIDHDWPVLVPAWFLFCNPFLILTVVRAALGATRAGSSRDR